jgi:hypothetical protein
VKSHSQKILGITALVLFAAALLAPGALAQAPASGLFQIGSANTVYADPRIPRPTTQPCIVPLFSQFEFDDFNPRPFTFTPPTACPGPWARVVLQADFLVTAGVQFDRTGNIWIAGTNVWFGTTAEPAPNVAPHWFIERDVTEYSSLFNAPQPGEVDLYNLVNGTYTGIIFGSANLQFYPTDSHNPAPPVPDMVLPMAAGPSGETVALTDSTSQLTGTFTLPTNVEQAYLEVFAQSQSDDEFWYTCVPDDVSTELESCSGTAYREGEVTIDGQPAGVAPIYPWIYTGGVDPFLWTPIPGVQTLNFPPYVVNLTPFAGLLSNGLPHTVALSVFNADNYFSATSTLLLYLDHGSTSVTGSITTNTLPAVPTPVVIENINTSSGYPNGTVSVTSARDFTIAGFVNTSHGTVTTQVSQNINFSNLQTFTINASLYQQDIDQRTTINSTISTTTGSNVHTVTDSRSYPLVFDISLPFNSDGSFSQISSVSQGYRDKTSNALNGALMSSTTTTNQVHPGDTLMFDAGGNFIGNTGQTGKQYYFSSSVDGFCFSRGLVAVSGLLSSVVNGSGCQ